MALTVTEQRDAIASWMPLGIVWTSFHTIGTNCYNFLVGLASEFVRFAEHVKEARETIPKITNNTDFLPEWESAMGIPDDCFSATGSTSERWTHVLVKFAMMNIQSCPDFVSLAAVFGFTITCEGGIESSLYPAGFPDDKTARNTIVITFDVSEPVAFPYTFPITFEQNQTVIMECMFTKLKPAHNDIQFLYV